MNSFLSRWSRNQWTIINHGMPSALAYSMSAASLDILKMLYAAGGMTVLLVVISMLGFSPFLFATWLLGFLITPVGMVVAAILGAAAIPVLRHLFSERKKLEPILKRLAEAKSDYDTIVTTHPDANSYQRRLLIDVLHAWSSTVGAFPFLTGNDEVTITCCNRTFEIRLHPPISDCVAENGCLCIANQPPPCYTGPADRGFR